MFRFCSNLRYCVKLPLSLPTLFSTLFSPILIFVTIDTHTDIFEVFIFYRIEILAFHKLGYFIILKSFILKNQTTLLGIDHGFYQIGTFYKLDIMHFKKTDKIKYFPYMVADTFFLKFTLENSKSIRCEFLANVIIRSLLSCFFFFTTVCSFGNKCFRFHLLVFLICYIL